MTVVGLIVLALGVGFDLAEVAKLPFDLLTPIPPWVLGEGEIGVRFARLPFASEFRHAFTSWHDSGVSHLAG